MKRILITLVAAASLVLTVSAQEKREMMPHPQMRQGHGMMSKELNLTEDQKKQAKQVNEEFRNKLEDLNKNENITVKEARDRKFALRREKQAKMQALLTPDQKAKMAKMRSDRISGRNEQFTQHLDKMKTLLGLTDQQVASLKMQKDNMQTKMMALRENQSLTREQKRDQLEAVRKEAKEQHEKIFTPEQKKKMEEMNKDGKQWHRNGMKNHEWKKPADQGKAS